MTNYTQLKDAMQMSEQELEKQLEDQYQADLHDLVDTWRTIRNVGKWAAALFAFVLVVVSILLALKELRK